MDQEQEKFNNEQKAKKAKTAKALKQAKQMAKAMKARGRKRGEEPPEEEDEEENEEEDEQSEDDDKMDTLKKHQFNKFYDKMENHLKDFKLQGKEGEEVMLEEDEGWRRA